jgi:hypothetical protein
MRIMAALLAVLACAMAPSNANAQQPEPAPQYFAAGGSWLSRYHLSPYGDLRLRFDRVRERPGATEDLERIRGRLRTGLVWSPLAKLSFEAGGCSGLWRAAEASAAAPFDNESDDSVAFDRLAAVIVPIPMLSIGLGKRPLPLATTDLTWDTDLRPVGITLVARRAVREFDEVRLAAAAVRRSEPDSEDGMLAAQLAYALRPGAADGGELLLGLTDFSNLDELAKDGRGRQNRLIATSEGTLFAGTFRVLEAQVSARTRLAGVACAVALHGITNLESDREHRGFRASTRFGEVDGDLRTELGYVFQVIEREALPGAYNSDDWWFHSRASGHRAWLAVRPVPWATVRLSAFDERRDDVARRTRRLLLDLELELPRE